ncbi:hypothetical protein [Microvirga roseola]|uniref:hypothetical protein n=1 Tax=Microvirga roseola TaxID=2883126 RepID=UPI001E4549CF|nr:hypothetical protein [Microvirga roseola]
MRNGFGAKAGWAVALLGVSVLAGCNTPGEGGMGVGDMLLTAGTSLPPAQSAVIEDVYCPPVTITEGGAALQVYAGGRAGDAGALRSQVALGQLARECVGQPDGSTLVKIGVQGRALLGAGGSPGRYDVPVRIMVKKGSTVFANRSRRMAVAIPPNDTQASFTVVEEGIVVPAANANNFEIEVGLAGRQG